MYNFLPLQTPQRLLLCAGVVAFAVESPEVCSDVVAVVAAAVVQLKALFCWNFQVAEYCAKN